VLEVDRRHLAASPFRSSPARGARVATSRRRGDGRYRVLIGDEVHSFELLPRRAPPRLQKAGGKFSLDTVPQRMRRAHARKIVTRAGETG